MGLFYSTYKVILYKLLLLSLTILFNSTAFSLETTAPQKKLQLAATEATNSYTFGQLGLNDFIVINGYKPIYTIYLPFGKYLDGKKAVLHLRMAFSPFLTQDTSVAVKLNQKLIRRLNLPKDLTKENGASSWDIELPLDPLSLDWQALTFSADLLSTKSLCDPNIWISISPESRIDLSSPALPFSGSLNQLPYPFLDQSAMNSIPVLLLLPRPFSMQELSSLLHIAMRLGQLAGDGKINLSVDFINDSIEKQKENNLILIGSWEQLSQQSGFQIEDAFHLPIELNNALSKKSGILLLRQSPFNPLLGLLTITGSDYTALQKAVTAFLTPEFKSLASGQIAIIDQIQTNPKTNPISLVYRSSFKELGYSDQSVSGLGRHKLTYNIPLPNDRVPMGAKIKTFITISTFPGNNDSHITLLVNGLKQSSFWFTKEHSAWSTEIDTNALKPGINRLDYLIDLHFKHEQCTRENYDEVWATVHSKTQFETSFFNDFPHAMLNQLPVPFDSEITVVLPKNLSKENLHDLIQLFFKFGQLFQISPSYFYVRASNEVDEGFIRNNNIILIGTPSNNPWVKFALDYMPVQLNRNSRLLKLPQRSLEVLGTHSIGMLQLMPSPWTEGKAILIVTGDSDSAVSWTIKKLINDKSRMNMNGNIALINSDQSTEILSSYDNRFISFKNQLTVYLSNLGKNIFFYLKTHPQIFVYLLVIIVSLVILFKRRNR